MTDLDRIFTNGSFSPMALPAHGRRELAVLFEVGEHLRGQKEFRNSLVYYLEGSQQFNVRGVINASVSDSREKVARYH